MNGNVNSLEFLLALQGQQCLVYKRKPGGEFDAHLATFVHVVGVGERSLHLCTRKKTDNIDFRVTQRLLEAVKPAREPDQPYAWEVAVH